MKKYFTLKLILCLVLLVAAGGWGEVKGCDRSSLSLDSVTFDGTYYTIHMTLCIGGGITGSNRGGDQDTYDFAFGVVGSPSIGLHAFSPPTVTSDITMVTNTGVNVGAQWGANFVIGYLSPGSPYTCITNTASCGQAHSDCSQFSITTTEMPFSIQVYGVEGNGNPISGCFSDLDMIIFFPVEWSYFTATQDEGYIDLQWATTQETNNDYFRIMRSANEQEWEELSQVQGAGNSHSELQYSFQDLSPQPGLNQYKIVQVDYNGASTESEIRSVHYEPDASLYWDQVFPLPTRDRLEVSFGSRLDQNLQLELFDLNGKSTFNIDIDARQGLNKFQLGLSMLPRGVYILRLKGPTNYLNKKIILI